MCVFLGRRIVLGLGFVIPTGFDGGGYWVLVVGERGFDWNGEAAIFSQWVSMFRYEGEKVSVDDAV